MCGILPSHQTPFAPASSFYNNSFSGPIPPAISRLHHLAFLSAPLTFLSLSPSLPCLTPWFLHHLRRSLLTSLPASFSLALTRSCSCQPLFSLCHYTPSHAHSFPSMIILSLPCTSPPSHAHPFPPMPISSFPCSSAPSHADPLPPMSLPSLPCPSLPSHDHPLPFMPIPSPPSTPILSLPCPSPPSYVIPALPSLPALHAPSEMDANPLHVPLPQEISHLTALCFLYAPSNAITGSIPSTIAALSRLEFFAPLGLANYIFLASERFQEWARKGAALEGSSCTLFPCLLFLFVSSSCTLFPLLLLSYAGDVHGKKAARGKYSSLAVSVPLPTRTCMAGS
ncbi:unnamed protein product [Closterium sp. Naga37s-1]|nr:unnamed protein product [Closterium sp. Naga37s-1]